MKENARLPVFIFNDNHSLPGMTIHLSIFEEQMKALIDRAQSDFLNAICLVFKKDESEQVQTIDDINLVCIEGSIVSKIIENDLYKVDITLTNRGKILDTFDLEDTINATVLVESDLNETYNEDELEIYERIKNKINQKGNFILKDPYLINNIIKNENNVGISVVCDIISCNLDDINLDLSDFLFELNFKNRLIILERYIDNIIQKKELDSKIEQKVQEEMNKEQKEYYLRKKIRIIQEELGDVDKPSVEADEIREKIENSGMHEKAKAQALKELKRYQGTNSASPESSMIRAYLDVLTELPWTYETEDNLDINNVRAVLDDSHSGLDKIKERIVDYLSVKLYSNKSPQTIICFTGPPGTGKTTLAISIAKALGRKFVKQSLGGVKDEAEIRGHRRTYLGALPGRIINGIKEAKSINPVFLLDEIDKLGADYKGDPSASLLEVLDPNQNEHFMDHYLELEYDLSKVMFICTANDLSTIPAPLRDRMEIIELSSYTELEKFDIARNHVIREALEKNGLESEKFELTDEAIRDIIKYYTREAGARQLTRCINTLVRKAITEIMSTGCDKVIIDQTKLVEMLGKKIYTYNITEKDNLVGVVNGLAYTQAGGDVLQIETLAHSDGEGKLILTGSLGDVMKESAQIAHNWVKVNGVHYNSSALKYDLYIHCPEGAVPKDGPSAGVTFVTSMVSAITNTKVRHDLAMTGEITLRGRVLPIGGLREKSIAAYRSGLKEILIPKDNLKDLEDIPQEVKDHLIITPVETLDEVLNKAICRG